ncbi:MAG: MBL fold metallo-hydrolase [Peptoclostridium sp.]|nr:MBL fold metallo-hydrolase [Peptoclostridium sp.]
MNMEKISGHSYIIRGGTNTGLYLFKDKSALLIDPGLTNSRGNRIIRYCEDEGIRPRHIVFTHEHYDHHGAAKVIMNHFTGASSYSSAKAKLIIENPEIFSGYVYGGKSNSFLEESFSQKGADIRVDNVLEAGVIKLGDKKFSMHEITGHSPGQLGIMTEDKVIYIGDAVFNISILEKYSIPFLYDIGAQLDSLQRLHELDFEYMVMGHEKPVLNREEAEDTLKRNIEAINEYIDQAREFLTGPRSREQLTADIIEYNGIETGYKQYYFTSSTIASIVSYLADRGEIDYEVESGMLFYYKK